jgi:endonuclease IV
MSDEDKRQQSIQELRATISQIEQQMTALAVEVLQHHPGYQYLRGGKEVLLRLAAEIGRAYDAKDASEVIDGQGPA